MKEIDKLGRLVETGLQKIEGKLDVLDQRLDRVDVTMVKQQAILDEHVRRTDLLEKKLDSEMAYVEERLEPIRTHVSQVKLLLKVVGALAAAGAGGFGLKELIGAIFG